ncbi:HAD-IA family hydrolase, partial [Candidatus Bipolaricaulota bacterium]|nr:HAD-IA family hydrolase [Candidatus Bipolaricaulota bacterium]
IRERLGLPQNGMPILDQLRTASPETRARGVELLHAAEAEGAANGQLIPGTIELLSWLRRRDIRCALITNNSRRSVEAVLAKHPLFFDLVLTRDDGAAKPEPDLFLKALEQLHIQPSHAVVVGDTHLDALAAHRAGIQEIHLVSLRDWMAALIPTDIAYKPAADLDDVHMRMVEWLKREDVSGLVE